MVVAAVVVALVRLVFVAVVITLVRLVFVAVVVTLVVRVTMLRPVVMVVVVVVVVIMPVVVVVMVVVMIRRQVLCPQTQAGVQGRKGCRAASCSCHQPPHSSPRPHLLHFLTGVRIHHSHQEVGVLCEQLVQVERLDAEDAVQIHLAVVTINHIRALVDALSKGRRDQRRDAISGRAFR